ncbi:exopolysaccharide biosynthesis protein [Brevirhabdus pacifica]|uniref:Exopolysaccharide biosynthesis protein n=2 Tax=Brevirhabdus pacifica TaxID=1267768 RepID=A0A1U7DM88_9RHOB|nr:exopolysaccharide biosynthesis protein [Brevirhabdus pacifica]
MPPGAVLGGGAALAPGFYRRGGKRALDLSLIALFSPLLAPLMLLLWLAVRAGGGAAFFAQDRVGLDGRVFRCWKLRSMIPDADLALRRLCRDDPALAAEWRRHQKLTADPRITRVGRLLRRTGLDELPQIWNVLRGEMSLVGPRPFMPSQRGLYGAAGGFLYYRMRPGLTGPWQVSGRSQSGFADRAAFDDLYHRTTSLRGDLRILLRTVAVVLCARAE